MADVPAEVPQAVSPSGPRIARGDVRLAEMWLRFELRHRWSDGLRLRWRCPGPGRQGCSDHGPGEGPGEAAPLPGCTEGGSLGGHS